MLVISRKEGESFTIGKDIKVYILKNEHHNSQIKVGIEAPRDVLILRTELDQPAKPRG